MAVALDTSSKSSSADYADTNYTWSHTCTGSDLALIVGATIWQDGAGNGSVTGITYNGVAMTLVREDNNGAMYSSLWKLAAPATGANTVSVTMDGASIQAVGIAASFTGVDQTTPVEADAGDNTDGLKTADVSVTTVTDNAWPVAVMAKFGTETVTPISGMTEAQEQAMANVVSAFGYRAGVTPAGASEMEWTWITNDRDAAISAAVLKPAAAAGFDVKVASTFAVL